jgi:hypothetical protein
MMQTGRELDALVAEKVMGWWQGNGWWRNSDGAGIKIVEWRYPDQLEADLRWEPSAKICDAWEVVEKLRADKEADFDLYAPAWAGTANMMGGNWKAMIDGYAGVADTAPLAICLAALGAVGHKEPA